MLKQFRLKDVSMQKQNVQRNIKEGYSCTWKMNEEK